MPKSITETTCRAQNSSHRTPNTGVRNSSDMNRQWLRQDLQRNISCLLWLPLSNLVCLNDIFLSAQYWVMHRQYHACTVYNTCVQLRFGAFEYPALKHFPRDGTPYSSKLFGEIKFSQTSFPKSSMYCATGMIDVFLLPEGSMYV